MKRLGDRRVGLARGLALIVVLLFGLASIIATGGGGGGSGTSSVGGGTAGTGAAGTGSVSVFLADSPADDYEHIWVWITQVVLIPPEGSGRGPVTIFKSKDPDGYKVDLLAYQEDDFLLAIKSDVPAGRYEKIRLEVSRVESDPECGSDPKKPKQKEWEIKLPSGKIDLNPQGGFEVVPGVTLAIRLDMDANKSINLHEAGNSGKCIFRPVVFVDISTIKPQPGPCPLLLSGTIAKLTDSDSDTIPEGFVLDLSDGRGPLTVKLRDEASLFDADGLPAAPKVLEVGQEVWVRGRLKTDTTLEASVVVVGEVLDLDGQAQDIVKDDVLDSFQVGVFPFLLDPSQGVTGQVDTVLFKDKTLVFRGCDAPADWSTIQKDTAVRVFGKLTVGAQDILKAAVAYLRSRTVTGTLTRVQEDTTGAYLTVDPAATVTGDEVLVFLPKGTPIRLEGDGDVPVNLLCVGRAVKVFLEADPSNPTIPTAGEVRVIPDELVGRVTAISGTGWIEVTGGSPATTVTVHVRDDAVIMDQTVDPPKLVDFTKLKIGQEVTVFGLKALPACNMNFEGFVAIIESKPT